MNCEGCGYDNQPADLACNLCGRVLATRLPRHGVSSRREQDQPRRSSSGRISRPMGVTKRLGKPTVDPKVAGLQRLQDAQARVTLKLKKLADVQVENVPILQAQIQAEQDERDLAEELLQAGETLVSNTYELRLAEDTIRATRKKLGELKFKLQARVEERMRAASEREGLDGELDSLRRIDRQLSGQFEEPVAAREKPVATRGDSAEAEIEGLQGVCMRLSERITILNLQLNDRDSYLHWLLDLHNPERGKERADEVTALIKSLGEGEPDDPDCVLWLEGEWKRLLRFLAGSSQR